MSFAKPDQPRGDAAQIDARFFWERHIGSSQRYAREQLLVLRRHVAEHVDHLPSVLLHFLLLLPIADQEGAGWKAGLTGRVLGMEMRGGEEELVVIGRQFGGYARRGGSIFRAQTGIHYQRCAATDHDRDIGKAHDGPDMVRY